MATLTLVFHSCHFNSRLFVTKWTKIKTPWLTDKTVATATSSTCWKNSITTSSFRVKTTSGTIIETERKKNFCGSRGNKQDVWLSTSFGFAKTIRSVTEYVFFLKRELYWSVLTGEERLNLACVYSNALNTSCVAHFLLHNQYMARKRTRAPSTIWLCDPINKKSPQTHTPCNPR